MLILLSIHIKSVERTTLFLIVFILVTVTFTLLVAFFLVNKMDIKRNPIHGLLENSFARLLCDTEKCVIRHCVVSL